MTLIDEVNQLYESIKAPLDRTSEGLMAELDFRCQWLARSAELVAQAQYDHDKRRGDESEKLISRNLQPSIFKELLDASCATEKQVLKLTDRLNSTLTHQIDAIRSILSFEKQSRALER